MRILVVDDDSTLRFTVRTALASRGYHVDEAEDGQQAVKMVAESLQNGKVYDAAILDVNMPKLSGMEALPQIKEMSPSTFCLILTAFSNVKDAVNAVRHGAYDYLEKPVDAQRILKLIDQANEASALVQQVSFSSPTLAFDEGRAMIGDSSSIQKVFDVINKLAKVETSVLVRGDSGTGKELVARAIHFNSHRKKGPFVAVNCAAIPENLIESELFGHEKGAFTGADRRKIGKFQFAEGGTIFLDEIGDISQQMQVKLLRVLQEKEFVPVGTNTEIQADVRILAATNKPLEKMIEQDIFRADLFYRLNVMPIKLPSLRDRREDIPPLADYMVNKFNNLHKREIQGFEKDALNALRLYAWPGNIRELENVVEHAFIIESSNKINLASLPEHIQELMSRNGASSGLMPGEPGAEDGEMLQNIGELNYPQLKERFEREFLIRALKAFDGRVNQTAEHTKMTKVTLLRKLDKYGIDPKQYHRQ